MEGIKFPVNRAFNDKSEYYRRRREDATKYLVARWGDWLFAPFQCELCWMINLHGRLPLLNEYLDRQEMILIRRANLDMFWSRETGTVRGLVYDLKDIINRATWRKQIIPLDKVKQWEIGDSQGMGIALLMLEKSIEPGRNSVGYKQFDTVRKFCSTASNLSIAMVNDPDADTRVMKSLKGAVLHMHYGPMQTIFMERFTQGMRIRMPAEKLRNLPLLGSSVAKILEVMEEQYMDFTTSNKRKREITSMCAGYIAVTYCYGLRGNEGMWVDADRLRRGIRVGEIPFRNEISHIIVSLLGRFKGEDGDRMHVFCLASTSGSGIQTRRIMERVANIHEEEKTESCPAFCNEVGFLLTEKFLEKEFLHPILEELQSKGWDNNAIPKGIEVRKLYRCTRSCRRGADITATNMEVGETVINFVHRWDKYEQKGGRQPARF